MKILLLYCFLLPLVTASCPFDHYWSNTLDKCLKCTRCRPNEVVKRPCLEHKNTLCRPALDDPDDLLKVSHHFQKTRLHFFDHDSDEELHMKNFLELENQNEGGFHTENNHHNKKAKHEKKQHKKGKKHFEFEEEGLMFDATSEKPKKHKKHFEFKKKHHNKKGIFLNSDEENDEKIPAILNDFKEREIELRKRLKHRKDDLLKTLKEESGENDGGEKRIRLNSPTTESDEKENYQDEYARLFKKWKADDDEKELASLMNDVKERFKTVTPAKRIFLGEPSTVSEIIGQVKDPEEVLKEEMGGIKWLFQKPKFKVVPVVVDSETKENEKTDEDGLSSDRDEMSVDGEGGRHDVVSMPFSAAETLVWDWQAVALLSAVATCSFFFLVVAVYLICNSAPWKKNLKSYTQEELSTRVALIHPTLDSSASDAHTTSLYLENLVAPKKDLEGKGVCITEKC